MNRLYSLLLLSLFCMVAFAQDYATVTDIDYRDGSVERCKLDVYYPTQVTDCPVVVWFHGGGLEGGNKSIPQQLQEQGLVVVAANYRFLTNATPAQVIDDAAAAVAWTFKNVARYNGSPRKVVVAGHSAGGYLTSMVGLDKHWLASYGVDADSIALLAPFSGQAISHFNMRKRQGISPMQPTIDDYAPLSHLRPDCPPIIITSGDRELELYGRYEEQAYMWRMLRLVGHPQVYLYEFQGFDHVEMMQPSFTVLLKHIKKRFNNK